MNKPLQTCSVWMFPALNARSYITEHLIALALFPIVLLLVVKANQIFSNSNGNSRELMACVLSLQIQSRDRDQDLFFNTGWFHLMSGMWIHVRSVWKDKSATVDCIWIVRLFSSTLHCWWMFWHRFSIVLNVQKLISVSHFITVMRWVTVTVSTIKLN